MRRYLFITSILFLASSVNSYAQNELPFGVKFEQKEVTKTYEGCNPDSNSCPSISIKYIQMTEGDYKDKINNEINRTLLNSIYSYDNKKYSSVAEMADAFIADYLSFRKEYPEAPDVGWYLDANFGNINELSQVLSFELSYDMFTGGAHPVNYQYYYNYDYKTGEPVTLAQLLIPGFESRLNALVEKAFREENNLGPNEPLTEAGLFEDRIEYSDNFLLTRNGIIFHYNIYEVRAYVYGPMDVTVPYSHVIDLIDENGLGIY